MIINTDDYNEIDDCTFLEYYCKDSLYLRIGNNAPKYYVKKGSVPKLSQIFQNELSILMKSISEKLSKQKVEEQVTKIKELKDKFRDLPCKELDEFIKLWENNKCNI